MSDTLRIALIAEGETDHVIIESALRAILPHPFVLNRLQPEPTRPEFGGGWGGVLKWCRDFRTRGYGLFEEDPTLELYDFFILHLDADVAHKSYSDVSPAIEQEAQTAGWGALPCWEICPPPEATVEKLKTVLFSWIGTEAIGDKTVLCIPSKSIETWLAVSVYPQNHTLLNGLECALNMGGRLANLPLAKRINKSVREYQNHAATVTREWHRVREQCSQAETFHGGCSSIVIGGTV
jgi:hypothetical protein